MFYQIKAGITKSPTLAVPEGGFTVGLISVEELEKIAPVLGFSPSTVGQCREEVRYFRNSIEVYDNYSFGTVKRTGGGEEGEDCVAFFVKKSLFLAIDIRDSDGSIKAQFESALRRFSPAALTLEKLIFAFFDAMIEADGRMLEDMEFSLTLPEEAVLNGKADEETSALLLQTKHRLLLLHNYYEQLIDLGNTLAENENDLFLEEDLRYFKVFSEKAERLSRNVRSLREQLHELREAYQSMLDIRLGNIMKFFAVLSAIFLPLTLITGWYGMNFKGMPELYWQHGYLFVIALSASVVLICIAIFRHNRFL